jgi:hypothetical protein
MTLPSRSRNHRQIGATSYGRAARQLSIFYMIYIVNRLFWSKRRGHDFGVGMRGSCVSSTILVQPSATRRGPSDRRAPRPEPRFAPLFAHLRLRHRPPQEPSAVPCEGRRSGDVRGGVDGATRCRPQTRRPSLFGDECHVRIDLQQRGDRLGALFRMRVTPGEMVRQLVHEGRDRGLLGADRVVASDVIERVFRPDIRAACDPAAARLQAADFRRDAVPSRHLFQCR